jgi:chromosome partitioning protein
MIIPGDQQLAGADNIITQTGKEYRLKERMGVFARHWDYIIIDTPPGLGILTVNALAFADSVIIPCLADVFSIQATTQIGETIQAVRKYCNPGLAIAGILLTRYNPRQILTRDTAATLEATAKRLGTRLFNSRIRETLAIREAQAQRTNIFDYAPKGNGAKDYNALIEELTAND